VDWAVWCWALTGLAGARAISLTTEAVESVVLAHLSDQLGMLRHADPAATAVVENIVSDEQEHHDSSARKLADASFVDGLLRPVVRGATEAVIWLGMRLP
jgi:3-demethoxyubiquinol 3-hydroxylase